MKPRIDRSSLRQATLGAVMLSAALLLPGSLRAAGMAIDMVTVGHAGNPEDPRNSPSIPGIGAVAYDYRIGTYEVTNAQYAAFLGAVAASDPYTLYNPQMASDPRLGGIVRAGVDGAFTYSVKAGYENTPVGFVSFWDTARFANWMNNGQGGAGSTETGAYALNGVADPQGQVTSSADAAFFLPSLSEWYKAAYYDPAKDGTGGYWQQATRSDALAGNRAFATDGARANYFLNSGDDNTNFAVWTYWINGIDGRAVTPVGAYQLSVSSFGTFDQAGNVFELTDTAYADSNYRWFAGGAWNEAYDMAQAGSWGLASSTEESGLYSMGFRLAGAVVAVPEPSNPALLLAGLVALGALTGWRHTLRGQRGRDPRH
jgi:formylglycine-generating enzyme required for sulfatase activity